MKHILKSCAAFFVATSLLFSFASCKSEDDDSSPVAVSSVELSETTATITVGGTKTLTATVKPDNATDKTVTWTSSDETVATVANGVVTAKKAGTASITAKAGNITATCAVTVSEVTYTVTVTSGTANPATAAAGATVTITANDPAEGKVFDKWTTETTGVTFTDESTSPTTFTMPASAVTVTATYKDAPAQTYAVTVTSGTANPTTAAAGTTVTITANDPAEGKVFDKWTTETTGVTFTDESASSTTFTMPASAVTITATYKDAPTYSVTIAESTSGTVTASKTSGILQNETITLTVTPDSGYKLNTIGAKTGETDITITNNTFVMPAGNVTVTATFEAASYSITLNVNGGAYAESYSAPTSYTYGTGATLPTSENITKTNYILGGWFISEDFSGDAVTVISTTDSGNKEYWAKWIPIYAVTVTKGTANPTTAAAGATVTITASDPAEGKLFDKWTTTSGVTFTDETASSTTFIMPASAVTVTATYKDAPKIVDLSTVTADTVVADGYTITGTLAAAVKVSIADGATVTLSGANINADSKLEGQSIAGLTCEGDATIIIADGSENTIRGIKKGYNVNGAGIFVPEGKTLTINGDTGILNAYGLGGAGIGANKNDTAGNVVISGGVITATGDTGIGCSDYADIGDITITGGTVTASSASSSSHAGIGASSGRECGNILITGGTVTANGKNTAPGIGCGGERYTQQGTVGAKCGTITIADTVTKVTATKGDNGTHGIGLATGSSCGTITIGGTVFWDGSAYQNDGETVLAASPFSYPKIVDLSTLTESTTVDDGFIITGTIPSKYMTITIADGATVTLKNVDMSIGSGIKCVGDATITLAADSTNVIQGLYDKAGIYVPENSTLIINGTGSLDVTASNDGAGIGGGWGQVAGNIEIQSGNITARGGVKGAGIGGGEIGKCGNITISGGNVTAIGGENGAGIGGGKLTSNNNSDCGNIVISGGTVIATGGEGAAGIGGGCGNVGNYKSTCGTITIASTVTSVTATKGSGAPYSIGAGSNGTCGTVTIGSNSTTYAAGVSDSPYTYQPSN